MGEYAASSSPTGKKSYPIDFSLLSKTTGTHLFPNGTIYIGSLINHQPIGAGLLKTTRGEIYEGFFGLDPKTEIGIHFVPENDLYEVYAGSFYEGERSGYGIIWLTDGRKYEGTVIQDRFFGKGFLLNANTNRYHGDFVDNQKTGTGFLTLCNGESFKGNFVNGYPNECGIFTSAQGDQIQLEHLHLGDLLFIQLLLGIKNIWIPDSITQHYILKFLNKTNNIIMSSLIQDALSLLIEAADQSKVPSLAEELQEDLIFGIPKLLPFLSHAHSMGLYIEPVYETHAEQLEFFIFHVYNSGEGLIKQQHNFDPNTNKFATRLPIQIPARSLTVPFVSQLLISHPSVEAAYETLYSAEGAQIISPKQEIWQTKQKGGNCTLEWMFVFLKHQKTRQSYDQLRLDLFKACVESADALHTEGKDKQKWEELRPLLLKKIKKREDRLNVHQASQQAPSQS